MTADVASLSPAPFRVAADSATVLDANGGAVAHFFHGSTPETKERAYLDAHSCALTRNAADVLMRRGWGVEQIGGKWFLAEHGFPRELASMRGFADPFTCLVESDRWYKENIEGAAPGTAPPTEPPPPGKPAD